MAGEDQPSILGPTLMAPDIPLLADEVDIPYDPALIPRSVPEGSPAPRTPPPPPPPGSPTFDMDDIDQRLGHWEPRLYKIEAAPASEESSFQTYYLRPSGTVQEFLRCGPADMDTQDDVADDDTETISSVAETWIRNTLHHRIHALQHSLIRTSYIHLYPEKDVIWLPESITAENVIDLNTRYHQGINAVQNILVEERVWDALLDSPDNVLESFTGGRRICVWLDSYRYMPGRMIRTRRDYRRAAYQRLQRDAERLQQREMSGRWLVEYIDLDGVIYGGFRTDEYSGPRLNGDFRERERKLRHLIQTCKRRARRNMRH